MCAFGPKCNPELYKRLVSLAYLLTAAFAEPRLSSSQPNFLFASSTEISYTVSTTMLDTHILLHVFLYISLLFLISILAVSGVYLIRIFKRRALTKAVNTDIEANMGHPQTKKPQITLPPEFYLDPVVYPSAAKLSMSSMRKLSTTVIAKSKNFGNNPSNSTPLRPPRSTRLDDLLAGFPYENHVSQDIWFPIANKETQLWELGVIRHAKPAVSNNNHPMMPINTRIMITSKCASFKPFRSPQ